MQYESDVSLNAVNELDEVEDVDVMHRDDILSVLEEHHDFVASCDFVPERLAGLNLEELRKLSVEDLRIILRAILSVPLDDGEGENGQDSETSYRDEMADETDTVKSPQAEGENEDASMLGERDEGFINSENGDALRNSLQESFQSEGDMPAGLKEFDSLGVRRQLQEAIRATVGSDTRPTPVQRLVIPRLLQHKNAVFAAETGSGKTIAYLVPILQQLLEKNEAEPSALPRAVGRPRALILCPTRELAEQVFYVAKTFCRGLPISVKSAIGGVDIAFQIKQLQLPVDILVCTVSRVSLLRTKRKLALGDVGHIVVDEVDNMLIQGFNSELKELIGPLLGASPHEFHYSLSVKEKPQVIMATATMTVALRKLITTQYFPPTEFLHTAGVNKALPTVKHEMVETKGRDKMLILKEVLKCIEKTQGQTMIFCNTIKSAEAVCNAVSATGTKCMPFHSGITEQKRLHNLKLFRQGDVPFFVCTDLASRGIDLPSVDKIIMFDFPISPIDYLHRAGRTGRMRRTGVVISLVTKHDRILATAIKRSIKLNLELHKLTGNKEDYQVGGPLRYLTQAGGYGRKPRDESQPRRISKARRAGWTPPKSITWHKQRAKGMKEEKEKKEKFTKTPKQMHKDRMTKKMRGRVLATGLRLKKVANARGKR